jgi:predicted dehydrogenase
MCAAAEASGLTFGVFENFRYRRDFRQYRWAFSEDGPAGKLQMALIGNIASWWAPDLIVAETPWRHVLDEAGGMALDLAPHFFDLLRSVGGEIKSVTARTDVVEPVRYLVRDGEKVDPVDCNADDTFYASYEFESGASGTLFASWAGHGTNTVLGEGAVFYGTKGRITGDSLHLDGESEPRSLNSVFEEEASEALKTKWAPRGITNDFALAQFDWLEAIKNGTQPETSGREGLLDLACSFGIVESSHAGRMVTVDEIADGSLRNYQKPIDEKFGLL